MLGRPVTEVEDVIQLSNQGLVTIVLLHASCNGEVYHSAN